MKTAIQRLIQCFLKIDVEGWELQCLLGMDFEKYKPWIVVIESEEVNTGVPSFEKWEHILFKYGYVFLGNDGLNRYYGFSACLNRLQPFKDAEKLKEEFMIVKYKEAKEAIHYYREKTKLKRYFLDKCQKISFKGYMKPVRYLYRTVKKW